jgi:hypothetical protein
MQSTVTSSTYIYLNSQSGRQSCSRNSRSNMELFRSLLRDVGLFVPSKVDIISELPLEISHLILRKLDPPTLQRAALVSRKWLNICRSDKCLRRRARRHMRYTKNRVRKEFLGPAAANATNQESRCRLRGGRNLRCEVSLSAARTVVVVGRIPGPPKMSKRNRPIDVGSQKCIRF